MIRFIIDRFFTSKVVRLQSELLQLLADASAIEYLAEMSTELFEKLRSTFIPGSVQLLLFDTLLIKALVTSHIMYDEYEETQHRILNISKRFIARHKANYETILTLEPSWRCSTWEANDLTLARDIFGQLCELNYELHTIYYT